MAASGMSLTLLTTVLIVFLYHKISRRLNL